MFCCGIVWVLLFFVVWLTAGLYSKALIGLWVCVCVELVASLNNNFGKRFDACFVVFPWHCLVRQPTPCGGFCHLVIFVSMKIIFRWRWKKKLTTTLTRRRRRLSNSVCVFVEGSLQSVCGYRNNRARVVSGCMRCDVMWYCDFIHRANRQFCSLPSPDRATRSSIKFHFFFHDPPSSAFW